ncbi:MAG: type 1 glutamine amidotransferase family protein [Chitinophagales bacterium]
MRNKNVYIFLFDGFADWEISYATPHIEKNKNYSLVATSLSGERVRSMGGLEVICKCKLAGLDYTDAAMIILPGGDAWEKKELREIIPVVEKFVQRQIPVAAICAATTLLADMKLLNPIKHTSNAKNYLEKFCPNYKGQKNYVGKKGYSDPTAVTDGNIITASGVAALEFAREIFRLLKIYDDSAIEKWYQLFKHGTWQE